MTILVIVESPAKAKTLTRYLGPGYTVLPTYGHIRDLTSKAGSVDPEREFACDWSLTKQAPKTLQAVESVLPKATLLVLATDPDREGEAIAWHMLEALKERKKLPKDLPVQRIVFHSVTQKAIQEAFKKPRELDQKLIEAYRARLSLDYLVGFTLSPLLWRKLPKSRSAGRVQSVALRAVVEREKEIEVFVPQKYWLIDGHFQSGDSKTTFTARLSHWEGQKLHKFSFVSEEQAKNIEKALRSFLRFQVLRVEDKKIQRKPLPPFMTSTLQQAASTHYGFSPNRTMKIAQELYEGIALAKETVGLITYMRTDSVTMDPEAIAWCREWIQKTYGAEYRPEQPIIYKSRAKNAQEAHEAIRPTQFLPPSDLLPFLSPEQMKIYELIWKRAIASQMSPAQYAQVKATLSPVSDSEVSHACQFSATGRTLIFEGFLKVYEEIEPEKEVKSDQKAETDEASQEGAQDLEEEESTKTLPPLQAEQMLLCRDIQAHAHSTQAPPRFSEAGLIKQMEHVGIGRPSTYARVMTLLQERGYVEHQKKRLNPFVQGRIVTAFLKKYFARYMDYSFTAEMENKLDAISAGELDWKLVLKDFWEPFYQQVKESYALTVQEVLQAVQEDVQDLIFPGHKTPPICGQCQKGTLGLKMGKFGAFIGCSAYPECHFIQRIDDHPSGGDSGSEEQTEASSGYSQNAFEPRTLGHQKGLEISVRKGPYGFYIQWGTGSQAKRIPVPKSLDWQTLDLETAQFLTQFPKTLGTHPETKETLIVGLGSASGPYLYDQKRYLSLKLPREKWHEALSLTLEQAIAMVSKNRPNPSELSNTKNSNSKSKRSKKAEKQEKT